MNSLKELLSKNVSWPVAILVVIALIGLAGFFCIPRFTEAPLLTTRESSGPKLLPMHFSPLAVGTTTPGQGYCSYTIKDGVIYWGAWPLDGADPNTFKVITYEVPNEDSFGLCLAEDATHLYDERWVVPNADLSQIAILAPQGTGNCSAYTWVRGAGVFHGVWHIAGSDPLSFKDITQPDGECYGKDTNAVYKGFKPLVGASAGTFIFLQGDYSRDATHVYYAGGFDNSGGPIPNADLNSFAVLSTGWAKDAGRAYRGGRAVEGADPASFQTLGGAHAKDKAHVYDTFGHILPNIDPQTVKSLAGGTWLLDSDHVYLGDSYGPYTTVVINANPATFVAMDGGYARDTSHVFFANGDSELEVKDADPKTLMVVSLEEAPAPGEDLKISYSFAKDAAHVYADGRLVAGADPKTFAHYAGPYYKDASHVYVRGAFLGIEMIPEADVATFVSTPSATNTSAKDARHTYGISAKGWLMVDPQY